MRISMRTVLAPVMIVLCVAGFAIACPCWVQMMGLDVWNIATYQQALRDGNKHMDARNEELTTLRQLISLKSIIVQNAIDGRITLNEAAEQFLELNRCDQCVYEQMRKRFGSASDEECAALQVIAHVRVQARGGTAKDNERILELERQLDEMRGGMPLVSY